MKKGIVELTLISLAVMSAPVHAAESCATKRASIERELHIAQQYSNTHKIAGLRQALEEVDAHCSHASVLADTLSEIRQLQDKLLDKQHDVASLDHDIRFAEEKGDHKKVLKYQQKREGKLADIAEINQKLKQVNDELTALNHS